MSARVANCLEHSNEVIGDSMLSNGLRMAAKKKAKSKIKVVEKAKASSKKVVEKAKASGKKVAKKAKASGKKVAKTVHAMVVPGSGLIKQQAESEGLDRVFREAGFEWREAGCSMCLAMNADVLKPGERCASTSNRNFEGRQGAGGRTHLVSPAMAVAAAIEGHFVDIRHWS